LALTPWEVEALLERAKEQRRADIKLVARLAGLTVND
jgi:hypothetical protein